MVGQTMLATSAEACSSALLLQCRSLPMSDMCRPSRLSSKAPSAVEPVYPCRLLSSQIMSLSYDFMYPSRSQRCLQSFRVPCTVNTKRMDTQDLTPVDSF